MRALIQRVTRASVDVEGQRIGEIAEGMLVFICAMDGDTDGAPAAMAKKISKLRIFRDENGRMNRSLVDVQGSALIVSQFTLAADTSRGNRPGFSNAAAPEDGERLYLSFIKEFSELGINVACGQFGADMAVELLNDGPVTIWIDV